MRAVAGAVSAVSLLATLYVVAADAPFGLTGPGLTNLTASGKQNVYWDADLGICFGNFVLLGDVIAQPNQRRVPNAIGIAAFSSNPSTPVTWSVQWDGLAQPFFPLLGRSTVPAGAVIVDDTVFVFMMNVSDWGNGSPGSVVANGFVTSGSLQESGFPTWNAVPLSTSVTNAPLVNAAPVSRVAVDGYIYMYATGLYRASPVYLARAQPGTVSQMNKYEWWSGGDKWGPASTQQSLPFLQTWGWVGEISVTYDVGTLKFVVCFFDYTPTNDMWPWLVCQSSPNPAGPWGNSIVMMTAAPPPWYQDGWYGPYGGYFTSATVNSTASNNVIPLLVSVWVPYRSFYVPMDFSAVLQ
jgi:hypothetical protein